MIKGQVWSRCILPILLVFSFNLPTAHLSRQLRLQHPNIQYGQLNEIFTSGTGWTQQYVLINQPAGIYTAVVTSPNAATVSFLTQMSSTVQLDYAPNKSFYQPNETAIITATLRNVPAASVVMAGKLFLPDGTTQTLVFNDAGQNGDTAASDGIFSVQFVAPAGTYYPSASTPYVRYEIKAEANGISRMALDTVTVLPNTARILGATGAFTTDVDTDGLINSLGITIALQVTNTGRFQLSGWLTNLSGDTVIAQALLAGGRILNPGTYEVALAFDGIDIRRTGINGPYRLSSVSLQDNSSTGITLQSLNDLFTTGFYSATQFEQPPLNIISATEQLLDTNNNGLAEALNIVVQPQGLTPGNYTLSADLIDESGVAIAYYDDQLLLSENQPITFTFSGQEIIHAFTSGPYRLNNVIIGRLNYGGDQVAYQIPVGFFDNVHTTAAYTPTQFEGVFTTLYGPVCTPLNRTGWATNASANAANSGLAKDGITTTVWSTAASQQPTHTFSIDMGSAQAFDGVQLDATGDPYAYLRTYDVQVSSDGVSYTSVASGTAEGANEVVRFGPQTARYVRVQPLASNPANWSLGEFNVCARPTPLPITVNGPTVTVTGTSPVQLEYLAFSGALGQLLHLSTLSAPSNGTRLIRIYRPTVVTGGDKYFVFFTTKDSQQEFEARLALLGKFRFTDVRGTGSSDALNSELILSQTGVYTYTGVPMGSYATWGVEGINGFSISMVLQRIPVARTPSTASPLLITLLGSMCFVR
ncbi:MAG: discoidin domain-containing protein [Anaerolineae bacterium]|nr:discoidin domain-containing protein [Anaerolineae bacterium]